MAVTASSFLSGKTLNLVGENVLQPRRRFTCMQYADAHRPPSTCLGKPLPELSSLNFGDHSRRSYGQVRGQHVGLIDSRAGTPNASATGLSIL